MSAWISRDFTWGSISRHGLLSIELPWWLMKVEFVSPTFPKKHFGIGLTTYRYYGAPWSWDGESLGSFIHWCQRWSVPRPFARHDRFNNRNSVGRAHARPRINCLRRKNWTSNSRNFNTYSVNYYNLLRQINISLTFLEFTRICRRIGYSRIWFSNYLLQKSKMTRYPEIKNICVVFERSSTESISQKIERILEIRRKKIKFPSCTQWRPPSLHYQLRYFFSDTIYNVVSFIKYTLYRRRCIEHGDIFLFQSDASLCSHAARNWRASDVHKSGLYKVHCTIRSYNLPLKTFSESRNYIFHSLPPAFELIRLIERHSIFRAAKFVLLFPGLIGDARSEKHFRECWSVAIRCNSIWDEEQAHTYLSLVIRSIGSSTSGFTGRHCSSN